MSARFNNVTIRVTRPGDAVVGDGRTVQPGVERVVYDVQAAFLGDISKSDRAGLLGLDENPDLRLIVYSSWGLQHNDRVTITRVHVLWRLRFGQYEGQTFKVVSVVNTVRGMAGFLAATEERR